MARREAADLLLCLCPSPTVGRGGRRGPREERQMRINRSKIVSCHVQEYLGRRAKGGLGDAVVGEVGFNTPYALVQHERLDFNHPKGGKAKYLEDNLKEQADRYQSNLNDHLRGALT
jgi:hypothetical protein